jgi:hypothetical protein
MPLIATRGGLSALAFGMFSAKAGGTIIVSFTAGSGTWLCPTGVTTVDYLVVAGGGGGSGGSAGGGGGGAGGFRTGTGLAVTAGTSYTVTVGGGGAAGIGDDI